MDRFVLGVALGRWQANCWVIGDHDRGSAVVVDPGEGGELAIPRLLERLDVRCEAVLLTHGHVDHLWAVPPLARRFDVPVLLHPEDRWLWDNPAATYGAPPERLQEQFGLVWDPPTEHLRDVADGHAESFAGIRFDVAHTPGHTPGHVTYLGRELTDAVVHVATGVGAAAVEEELHGSSTLDASDDVLFSGDLVFAGSIGRTDFPRGSTAAMMASLAASVLPLQDTTLILSGHGASSTVGHERLTNPFLAQVAGRT